MATINGDNGNNVLAGTEDEDVINGFGGNDTIDSLDRPANIFAGSVNPRRDVVDAGAGDDVVTGGKLDQLDGGDGNDFLLLNFNFNGPVAGSAPPITLTLDATGTGTASDGTAITGFEAVNLNLSDTGDNVVNTGNVRAQITGGTGNDTLTTGSADDGVFGGGGDNVIATGGGNDTISAGSGNDRVSGGDGDDTFGVNVYTDGSDQVDLGAGNDTVRFDRFDGGRGNIRLTFTSAEVGNGNTSDSGTLANQDGGLAVRVQAEAADGSLTGPISRYDDEGITFVAGTQGITFDVRDLVSGAARGNTFEGVVLGTGGNDALTYFPPFRAGQDFYYNAGRGDDTILAGAGNDFLVGGVGNDRMIGGGGNDTYIVDSLRDVVTEAAGGGTDTVLTGLARYELAANVENLTYTGQGSFTTLGNALANVITGGARNDIIRSGAGNDTLIGNAGNDTLDGGTGADRMVGRAGNDLYTVDDAGDVIDERGDAVGIDSVRSSVSYALGINVENLLLTGTGDINGAGNGLANRIIGNEAANRLFGGDGNDQLIGAGGNDTLIGGTGADRMTGGSGNDLYFVDNAGDRVDEADDATGIDSVSSSISYVLGTNVENLSLTGTAAIDGTGSALANRIIGNEAANVLSGGGGNDQLIGGGGGDTLVGGAGRDTLTGGAGADRFLFGAADAASADNVTDFQRASGDTLQFSAGQYGLSAGNGVNADGTLDADYFMVGTRVTGETASFLLNTATNQLLFDADGAGSAGAVLIATFAVAGDTAPADLLRASDVLLVA